MEKILSTTAPVTISFNGPAALAFDAKHKDAHRFRVDVRNGTLFIKPTHRKVGPHVFTDYVRGTGERGGLKVTIDGAQMDKLKDLNPLEAGQKYAVQEDRYGWFYLTSEDSEGALAGAKASVLMRRAAKAEHAANEEAAAETPASEGGDKAE
jgi:hypothetical protein